MMMMMMMMMVMMKTTMMMILGTTLCDDLSADVHISKVLESCAQSLLCPSYPEDAWDASCRPPKIARATSMSRLLYAASSWWGFVHATNRQRIEHFVQWTVRMGYLPSGEPDAETLVTDAENRFLTAVNQRHYHVLRPLFPPVITRRPGLLPCPHDITLPHMDNHNYISRVAYFIAH